MQLSKYIFPVMCIFICMDTFASEQTGLISPSYCGFSTTNDANAPGGIDVLYLNGIDNTPMEALASQLALQNKIIKSISSQYPEGIRTGHIYNPAGSIGIDQMELRDQAQAEAEALKRAKKRVDEIRKRHPNIPERIVSTYEEKFYSQYLAEVYTERFLQEKRWDEPDQDGSVKDASGSYGAGKEFIGPMILKIVAAIEERLLAGRRVVIVAHSQGNHFIEASYAILETRLTSEQLAGLQVVGVAVVAHTTPNDHYVTIQQDAAVAFWNMMVTNGTAKPLPFNFDAMANKAPGTDGTPQPSAENVTAWDDGNGHNFIKIYLNNQIFRRIYYSNEQHADLEDTLLGEMQRLVKEAIDTTVAPPSTISLGVATATLSWINDTDIDLHVMEKFNDGSQDTHVFYSNRDGRLGYLDLDDTDGQGPEHYYTNTFTNIDLTGDDCEALSGKSLVFSVFPYSSLPDGSIVGEPIVLNIRVGSNLYSRSFILKNSDATDNGKVIFTLTFNSRRQFTISDDL